MLMDMGFGRSKHDDAVRITTAGNSRAEDVDARLRGYLISMSFRVVCFGAAVVVGPGWLRWVLMAGAVFLPYIAVVMANATDQRDSSSALRNALPTTALPGAEGPRPLDTASETPGDPDDHS